MQLNTPITINGNPVDRCDLVKINQTTPFVIRTFDVNSGEAGVMMVHCIAVDNVGNAMSGAKLFRYRKTTTGVLTIGTIQNLLAIQRDTGMTTADFGIVVNANNGIDITVTGVNNKDIVFQVTINPINSVSFSAQ